MARPIEAVAVAAIKMCADREVGLIREDDAIEPAEKFWELPRAVQDAVRACPKTLCNTFIIFLLGDETFVFGKDDGGYLLIKKFLGDQPISETEPVLDRMHMERFETKLRKPWSVVSHVRSTWTSLLAAMLLASCGVLLYHFAEATRSAIAMWVVAAVLYFGYMLIARWIYKVIMREMGRSIETLKLKSSQ